MSGIGDQTPDTTKGLKVISDNVTIGIATSVLNPTFVNICEPLLPLETFTRRILGKKNPGTNPGQSFSLGWGKPNSAPTYLGRNMW